MSFFQKLSRFDIVTFIVYTLLASVGLIALYGMFSDNKDNLSAFFMRQLLFVVIGIVIVIIVGNINYNIFSSYATPLYIVMIILLILVLALGNTIRGTVGWITLFGFNLQVVEIVKVLMIIFLASFISTKRALLGEMMTIIVSFVLVGVIVGLVLMQPDTGSALVVLAIWLGMIMISGIRKRYVLSFVAIGLVVMFSAWLVLAPYQKARITNFLHPENDPKNTGYNVIQSIVAVGNGGFWGQGIGTGTQSKLNFLPEKHTDFIFASFTESMGFLGAFSIFFLFFVLFSRMRRIALLAKNEFGYFLVVGLSVLYFVHMLVNIGMNIGVMPVTGIPLPFISYGGSAMVAMSFGIGLLLSIYKFKDVTKDSFVSESY